MAGEGRFLVSLFITKRTMYANEEDNFAGDIAWSEQVAGLQEAARREESTMIEQASERGTTDGYYN